MSFVNIKKRLCILDSFVLDTHTCTFTIQLVVLNGATAGWKFASVQTLYPRYVLDMCTIYISSLCLRHVHILK